MTDFEKKWLERHPETADASPRQTAEEKAAAGATLQPSATQTPSSEGALRVTRTYQPVAISQQSHAEQSDFEKRWLERHPETADASPRQTAEEKAAAEQSSKWTNGVEFTDFEKGWFSRHPEIYGGYETFSIDEFITVMDEVGAGINSHSVMQSAEYGENVKANEALTAQIDNALSLFPKARLYIERSGMYDEETTAEMLATLNEYETALHDAKNGVGENQKFWDSFGSEAKYNEWREYNTKRAEYVGADGELLDFAGEGGLGAALSSAFVEGRYEDAAFIYSLMDEGYFANASYKEVAAARKFWEGHEGNALTSALEDITQGGYLAHGEGQRAFYRKYDELFANSNTRTLFETLINKHGIDISSCFLSPEENAKLLPGTDKDDRVVDIALLEELVENEIKPLAEQELKNLKEIGADLWGSVAYYQDDGTAMTWDQLVRMKWIGDEQARIEGDAELAPAFEAARAAWEEDHYVEKLLSDINEIIELVTPVDDTILYNEEYYAFLDRHGISRNISPRELQQKLGEIAPDIFERKQQAIYDFEEKNNKAVSGREKASAAFSNFAEYWEYLERVEEQNQIKKADAQFAKDHPILATVGAMAMSPFQIFDAIGNGLSAIGHSDIDDIENFRPLDTSDDYATNFVRDTLGTVAEEIGKDVKDLTGSDVLAMLVSTVYSGTTSAITSGVTGLACIALFGPHVGPAVALTLMSGGAASQTMQEASERGVSNGAAVLSGVLSGAIEALTEKIGLDELIKLENLTDLSSFRAFIKTSLSNFGDSFKQGGVEAGEEVLSAIGNIFADAAINGKFSEYNTSIERYMADGMTREEAERAARLDLAIELGSSAFGGLVGGMFSANTMNVLNNMGSFYEQVHGKTKVEKQIDNALGAKINLKGVEGATAEDVAASQQKIVELGLAQDKSSATHKAAVTIQKKIENGKDVSDREIGSLARKLLTGNSKSKVTADQLNMTKSSGQSVGVDNYLIDIAMEMSSILGRAVVFYSDDAIVNGTVERGYHSGGVLHVNAAALTEGGKRAENLMTVIIGHEFVHSIEGTAAYEALTTFVKSNMKDYKVRFDAVKDTYSRAGKYESDEQVRRDLYANYISELLFKNKKDVKRLAKNNRSLVMKLYELVNKLLDAIGFKGASERLQLLELRRLLGDALGADVRAQVFERAVSAEKKSLAALYDPEVVEAAIALREGEIEETQYDSVFFKCLREKDEVYGRFEVTDELTDAYENLIEGEISFEEYEDIYNSELERGEEREYSVENLYDYTKSFQKQLNDYVSDLDNKKIPGYMKKIPSKDSLLVGKTPEIFVKCGFNRLPMTINLSHVRMSYYTPEIKNANHDLRDILGSLPEMLEEPVAIFEDDGSVIAILKHRNKNGDPIYIPFKVDGFARFNESRLDSNAIESAYGRDNAYVKKLNDAIDRETEEKIAVFYINKEEAHTFLRGAEAQLPGGSKDLGFIHSIRDEGSPVKMKFENVTETQQFKDWFGDWQKNPQDASEFVDDIGKPLIMYSIRTKAIDGEYGTAYYFTAEKQSKDERSYYLNARKPYIITLGADLREHLAKYSSLSPDAEELADIPAFLRSKGFDGVMVKDESGRIVSGAVFDATQRKFAEDTYGTFFKHESKPQFSVADVGGRGEVSASELLADFVETESERKIRVAELPKTAALKFDVTVRRLVSCLGAVLSVPKKDASKALRAPVYEFARSFIENGELDGAMLDELFETAYANGVVVASEFYEQYKHIKETIRDARLTLSEENRSDVGDYQEFRRRNLGIFTLLNEGGLTVESFYLELQEMAPELFPADIEHPAEQLMKIAEVARSIKPIEYTLDEAAGNEELRAAQRLNMRRGFDEAVKKFMPELEQVRVYTLERVESEEASSIPVSDAASLTEKELNELHFELRRARRKADKVRGKYLMTRDDMRIVELLLSGDMKVEEVSKDRSGYEGIMAVYEAKREAEMIAGALAEYKAQRKAALRALAYEHFFVHTGEETEPFIPHRDKKMGVSYAVNTVKRNIYDIIKDPETAERIYEEYFAPVTKHDTEQVRFYNSYMERVLALGLDEKIKKGDTLSEAAAVQIVGEALSNIKRLEESKWLKSIEGRTLEEWQKIIASVWEENNFDKAKILDAIDKMRAIYNELFVKLNEVRVRNGYAPIEYRKGYFPHFRDTVGEDALSRMASAFGIRANFEVLPTAISGRTKYFRPGMQWNSHALKRQGYQTAYDAIRGFEGYIGVASRIIAYTDDIQKLRALSDVLRYEAADDETKQRIERIRETVTDEEARTAAIRALLETAKKKENGFSGFVNWIEEYTNRMAGKKSTFDRTVEELFGRKFYEVLRIVNGFAAKYLVVGNVGTWMTNLLPLFQAASEINPVYIVLAMKQLSENALEDHAAKKDALKQGGDGLKERSEFLVRRKGKIKLNHTASEKISDGLMFGMEKIDMFVAETIVRARIMQNMKKGLSESEAMAEADIYAAELMADRSDNALPTIFSATNPLFKTFTMFQVEVANQFFYAFKDIPRKHRKEGLHRLAWALFLWCLTSWIGDELFEALFGRRPLGDTFGMLNDFAGNVSGYKLPNMFRAMIGTDRSFETKRLGWGGALAGLGEDVLQNVPFVSNAAGGGRVETPSVFREVQSLIFPGTASSIMPDWSALGNSIFKSDWTAGKRIKTAADALLPSIATLATGKIGGGSQLIKMIKGIDALVQGGSYSYDSQGNRIMQYPVLMDNPVESVINGIRAVVFGKSSLPTAQEWVEGGFDSLSAKETAAFIAIKGEDVSGKDALAFIKALGAVEGVEDDPDTKDDEKKSATWCKLEAWSEYDISDEAKGQYYYAVLASDSSDESTYSEFDLMTDLIEAGCDIGEVSRVLCDFKLSSYNKEESYNKRKILYDSSLSQSAKQQIYTSKISDAESRAEDIRTCLDAGLVFDDYLLVDYEYERIKKQYESTSARAAAFARWIDKQDFSEEELQAIRTAFGSFTNNSTAQRYQEFLGTGMSEDLGLLVNETLEELEPVGDAKSVTALQKYEAIFGLELSREDTMRALSVIMPEKEYGKFSVVSEQYAITPEKYVAIKTLLPNYDSDGNGSYKHAEIENAIDSVKGLTKAQKGALWQILTSAKSSKKNPFSVSAGQFVLDNIE